MSITLADVLNDPRLYLYEIDADSAHFLQMKREDYLRSIFLDGRIRHAGAPPIQAPLNQLLSGYENAPGETRSIGWIFHIAQCGSTLLARALDHPGRSLVLREPAALRRVGIRAGGSGQLDEMGERLLPMVRHALAKRWEQGAPLVIKGTVPVNFIADRLMRIEPEAPAVMLYFPLSNYVAATLRTPGHVDWTERVFDEMRMADSEWCEHAAANSPAEKAAALWLSQMILYSRLLDEFPNVYSLHAAEIFDNAEDTVIAAAELFGVSLRPGEAREICESELYHSYSKNPALDYDPEVRLAREAESIARLEKEIAAAHAWAAQAAEKFALPERFSKPLVGDAPRLLQ